MEKFISFATKICLLTVVFTMCALMFLGAITEKLDYKDITIAFVGLLSAMTGFYFAYKGDPTKEFLGK
jgi:hypothetical protein